MADVVAGDGVPFRMDQFHIQDYTNEDINVLSQSDTLIVADAGQGYTLRYTGLGFRLANGEVAGGTLTGLEELLAGSTTFKVTGLNVSLQQFADWGDREATVEALTSMFGGDDTFRGSSFTDVINAYAGNDIISGGGGADVLVGGAGNDHLYGNSATALQGQADGADSIFGGSGADYLQGNAGNDTLSADEGADRLFGGGGNDLLSGGDGPDQANGNLGDDTINGDNGNDILRGGQGADQVNGGADNDNLYGDLGNDTLTGGAGLDALFGGGGSDIFLFAPADASSAFIGGGGLFADLTDVIADYEDGADEIRLGSTVTAVLTDAGATFSSLTALRAHAQTLLDATLASNASEVVALRFGSDTYLFATAGGSSVTTAIKVIGVAPGLFTAGDFNAD